jgi:hypothetical protein
MAPKNRKVVNVVLVGDTNVGKTAIAKWFQATYNVTYHRERPDVLRSTAETIFSEPPYVQLVDSGKPDGQYYQHKDYRIFDFNFSEQDQELHVILHDTDVGTEQFRDNLIARANVVLFVCSMQDPTSQSNLLSKWQSKVTQLAPQAKTLLIATHGSADDDCFFSSRTKIGGYADSLSCSDWFICNPATNYHMSDLYNKFEAICKGAAQEVHAIEYEADDEISRTMWCNVMYGYLQSCLPNCQSVNELVNAICAYNLPADVELPTRAALQKDLTDCFNAEYKNAIMEALGKLLACFLGNELLESDSVFYQKLLSEIFQHDIRVDDLVTEMYKNESLLLNGVTLPEDRAVLQTHFTKLFNCECDGLMCRTLNRYWMDYLKIDPKLRDDFPAKEERQRAMQEYEASLSSSAGAARY